MNVMNALEMRNANAGGGFGKKFTCGICGHTKRYWDWRFIFWSKSSCQDYVESRHFYGAVNYSSKVH